MKRFPRYGACVIVRPVYYVALGTDRFYMMAAYPKSERDDLSTEQRRRILVTLESIKKEGR